MALPDPAPGTPAIYLLGMMGVGKSTIGKKTAALLGYTFIDLDKEIEQQEQQTISELFEKQGEAYFRLKESTVLRSLDNSRTVIATGGGTPCYHHNMEYILKNGISIYLKANPGLIFQRISRYPAKRPLLKGMNEEEIKAFVIHKLAEREPYYTRAKYICEVPGTSAETIVNTVLSTD